MLPRAIPEPSWVERLSSARGGQPSHQAKAEQGSDSSVDTAGGARMNRDVTRSRLRRPALALMLVLTAGLIAFVAPSAEAAALTSVNWTVTNNQVSATSVTYSYSFKTATAGTIKSITFAVSGAGLGGAPAINKNYGIGAGTVARAGQTITY